MKFDDLKLIYHYLDTIRNDINALYPDDVSMLDHDETINWILDTIHEELRKIEHEQLESNQISVLRY